MAHPRRRKLGSRGAKIVYSLQPQHAVIDFVTSLERANSIMDTNKIHDVFRVDPWCSGQSSRESLQRWCYKGYQRNSEWIVDLNVKYAKQLVAAPVYFASKRSLGSAISPRPGRFVVELDRATKPKDLEGGALGLQHHRSSRRRSSRRRSSRRRPKVAADFHYFMASPGGDDFATLERILGLPGVRSASLDWRTLMPLVGIPPTLEEYLTGFISLDDEKIRQAAYKRLREVINLTDQEPADLMGPPLAIIDTGFDLEHPALKSFTDKSTHFNSQEAGEDILSNYNAQADSSAHGTAVAGIVAAKTADDELFASVAPEAPVMPLKIPTMPSTWDFVSSLRWAVEHEARVVNMSFHVAEGEVKEGENGLVTSASKAVKDAFDAGVILCAAAGNHYESSNGKGVEFPARHDDVIAVGAINTCLKRQEPVKGREGLMWGSRFGKKLDVVAPGTFCWTTDLREPAGYNLGGDHTNPFLGDEAGHYTVFHGTSAATAYVSGLAFLLRSNFVELSAEKIRSVIERSCRKLSYEFLEERPNGPWNKEVGYGLIDVARAFELAEEL